MAVESFCFQREHQGPDILERKYALSYGPQNESIWTGDNIVAVNCGLFQRFTTLGTARWDSIVRVALLTDSTSGPSDVISPGAPLTFPGLHLELAEGLFVTGRDDGVLPVELPLGQQLHQLPGRALRAHTHQGEPGTRQRASVTTLWRNS